MIDGLREGDDAHGNSTQLQDETPNGRWETLAGAFAAYGFPPENLAFVQRLVDAIGITHYEGIQSRGYIKAFRGDGGRWLYIHSGYTGGLQSEEEILGSLGDVDRDSWKDGRDWWVTHPVNSIREGGYTSSRSPDRKAEFCEIHGLQLPASGICDMCAA